MPKQKISPQIIQQIKDRIDLVNLVDNYLKLDRRFKTICPFHSEKTPSFVVNRKRKRWHCFGCGASGDVFDFIQEIENLSFSQAVSYLAKEAGVSINPPKSERFKSYQYRRAISRKERLSILWTLENAFIEYERCMADCLLIERRSLPHERKFWDSMDYLEEQLLDYRFEKFNELQKRREEEFSRLRREA